MTQQKDIDDKILKLWVKDKNKAFTILVEEYQERLYWHIRSIVIVHESADDVCQNTLIKVYQNLHRFEGQSGLYTWMYRIASNESIDFLRKHKRKRTEDIENHQFYLESVKAGAEIKPEVIMAVLDSALATLPEKQRQVFQLRYFGQKSYEEISKLTETSVGGLKANYHHAVKKITAFIKERISIV